MSRERDDFREDDELDSQLGDVGVDSADLHGNVGKIGFDHSFAHHRGEYDENSGSSGPGGDDTTLQGSTGVADDIGMHIEPGFSVGYDQDSEDADIGPDTGNEIDGGGYLSLGDAAEGFEGGANPDDEVQSALGVDVGENEYEEDADFNFEENEDEEGSYGVEGTDSDLEGDEAD